MSDEEIGDVDPIVGGVRWRSMSRSEYHVSPTYAVRPVTRERDGDPPHGDPKHRRPVLKIRSPSDLTELHGIPENSLSAPLRQALMQLIDESGVMHDRLVATEHRIEFLEEHSRYDRLGEWLSTAAMLGQVRHLADLDQRESITSSLAGIELTDYRMIASRRGWSAAEQAMARVGSVLSKVAPSGDVVGRLWDGTFGVLLPGLTGEMAQTLVTGLAAECHQEIPQPGDQSVSLAVQTAIVEILPGEEPDASIDRLYGALKR